MLGGESISLLVRTWVLYKQNEPWPHGGCGGVFACVEEEAEEVVDHRDDGDDDRRNNRGQGEPRGGGGVAHTCA